MRGKTKAEVKALPLFMAAQPNVTTYGQTFTVPTGNTNLASFGLSLRYRSGDTSNFQFYVAPWGGDRISAAPLYSSPVVTTPAAADDLKDYVFTPKVNLTAGVKYKAIFMGTLCKRRPIPAAKLLSHTYTRSFCSSSSTKSSSAEK